MRWHASGTAQPVLFNSVEYFLFLAGCLGVYYTLPHRAQNIWLLIASYAFYAFWDWRFLGLILASTFIDYSAGRIIHRARVRRHPTLRRVALWMSLSGNLLILCFFKYFNFFVESVQAVLGAAGYDPPISMLHIILPVGISFYTFQTMSYTIEVYRGGVKPTRNLLDFALFVAFFPQLIAGPIERATSLLPQIQRRRFVQLHDLEQGVFLLLVGLFRKVVIADTAGLLVDEYFARPAEHLSIPLWCGLVLYSIQIYNDFAGYSDMARGAARLLGFTLIRNFRHPYFALNPSDFWRRWHISLSQWLRDYLYIPLGGSRHGWVRTKLNLMITMLLGGLWHGASWNFVLWGGLHGLYLVVHHHLAPRTDAEPPLPSWRAAAQIALTFTLVTFTWLFFRSPDYGTTIVYLQGLLAFGLGGAGAVVPVLVLGGLMLAVDLPQAAEDDEYALLRWPVAARTAVASAGLFLFLMSGDARNEPFIYFQF
jgi:alginate O-acetyltransferase complex protein AlgI